MTKIQITCALSAASATHAVLVGAADNVPGLCYIFDHDERHRELASCSELWCPAAIPRKPPVARGPAGSADHAHLWGNPERKPRNG